MKTDALDNLLACLPNGIAADSKAELQDLKASNAELLAALESLASDFRTTTRDCDKWNGYAAAVQAIAKAKGVSHE